MDDASEVEPIARCAHQVVYDPRTQTFYVHGGNAGGSVGVPPIDETGREIPRDADDVAEGGEERDDFTEPRLDDFWSMKLERYA